MTMAEKILARSSGKDRVKPGDIISAAPDFGATTDFHVYPRYVNALKALGKPLYDPERLILLIDHGAPSATAAWAEKHAGMRRWAKEQGLRFFYDVGRNGIGHQLLAETGHAQPGSFVLTDDFQCTPLGATGSFATSMGSGILEYMTEGRVWMKVPASIRLTVTGKFQPWVGSRDLSQLILNQLGPGGAMDLVVEFGGDGVAAMTMDERMNLCARVVYSGAMTAIVEPDEKTVDRFRSTWDPLVPDMGLAVKGDDEASYVNQLHFDVSDLEPVISPPGDPLNAAPVSAAKGVKIDQAFVGSCASGRWEDLVQVAQILKGRKVAPGVRFLISPPSQYLYIRAAEEGLLGIMAAAGATILPPTCGPCYGGHFGLLAAGETCITTSVSNIPGRMGSKEAEIYLASAATVAATAVAGEVVHPAAVMM